MVWFGIRLDKTMRYLRLFAYGWIVQIESVQIQVGGSLRKLPDETKNWFSIGRFECAI